jgi:hypothetical protein
MIISYGYGIVDLSSSEQRDKSSYPHVNNDLLRILIINNAMSIITLIHIHTTHALPPKG